MKLLLDECLPKKLKHAFLGHKAVTVPEMGWAGKRNGELLDLAANEFDVFVTADQNLQYQQTLQTKTLAVLVLRAPNNRLATLKPLIPLALKALQGLRKGEVRVFAEEYTEYLSPKAAKNHLKR